MIATLQPIVEALNKILDGNGSTVDIIKGIFKCIKEVEAAERDNKDRMEMQAEDQWTTFPPYNLLRGSYTSKDGR